MGAFDAAVSRNAAAADRSERPSPEKPLANGGRRKFADVSAEITQGKLPKRPRTCSAAGLISAAPHDLPPSCARGKWDRPIERSLPARTASPVARQPLT